MSMTRQARYGWLPSLHIRDVEGMAAGMVVRTLTARGGDTWDRVGTSRYAGLLLLPSIHITDVEGW
ncbi:MAG: hypothetical protein AMXMBFR61_20680 [Fimbriimonadales bacterium]